MRLSELQGSRAKAGSALGNLFFRHTQHKISLRIVLEDLLAVSAPHIDQKGDQTRTWNSLPGISRGPGPPSNLPRAASEAGDSCSSTPEASRHRQGPKQRSRRRSRQRWPPATTAPIPSMISPRVAHAVASGDRHRSRCYRRPRPDGGSGHGVPVGTSAALGNPRPRDVWGGGAGRWGSRDLTTVARVTQLLLRQMPPQ